MKQIFATSCLALLVCACATRMETKAGLLSPSLFPDYFGIQWRADGADWKSLGDKTSCTNIANGSYKLFAGASEPGEMEGNMMLRVSCVDNKPQTWLLWKPSSGNASTIPLDSYWMKAGQNIYFAIKWPVMDDSMREQLALSANRVELLTFIYRVKVEPGQINLLPSAVSPRQKNGLDFFLDRTCLQKLEKDEPATLCAYVPIQHSDLSRELENEVSWQSDLPLHLKLMRDNGK